MTIERKDIEKIAHLARISLQEEDMQVMNSSLPGILAWVEQLEEVDTSQVEPLFSVNVDHLVTRPDKVHHQPMVDQILKNAPEKGFDMFAVPKVVE
jgi:aspartyl-tRNA(Asn)/glutamyl-tRNA(Gln) amidotransferase subunit C